MELAKMPAIGTARYLPYTLSMDLPQYPIALETEFFLQQHGGPLSFAGQQGEYVVMRSDVYKSMIGLGENDEAETLASVRRGLEDMESGRTQELDAAFNELDDEK
jgi:hypothetical protein